MKTLYTTKSRIVVAFLALIMMATSFAFPAYAATYGVSVQTSTYTTLYNLGSGKMLNVYGSRNQSNTNVTVYAKDNTSGQDFMFISKGSGKYVLQPRCATTCALNVYGTKAQINSNVNIWTKSGNPTQSWIIDYNASLKGFVIRSADNTDLVLTATGSSNSSNVRLERYSSSNKYQIWTSSALSATSTTNASSSSSTSQYQLCWPVSTTASGYRTITSSLGARTAPVAGASVNHKGIDIGVACGSKVLSAADGMVVFVGSNSARGKYILIYHENIGITSVYQHLSSQNVKVNQKVSKGEVIGTSGNSGNVSGPHLHFELVMTSQKPTTVDCAWQSGAQLLDGHYENTMISYEFRK